MIALNLHALNLAGPDLWIVLAIAVLLFGGSRLAGLGKGAGRALREFKEETSTLTDKQAAEKAAAEAKGEVVTGEIVSSDTKQSNNL